VRGKSERVRCEERGEASGLVFRFQMKSEGLRVVQTSGWSF
jgi:hypothetical protein